MSHIGYTNKCRRVTHVIVISWTLPSSLSLLSDYWGIASGIFVHTVCCCMNCFVTFPCMVSFCFLWCRVASTMYVLGSMKNSIAWCDKEWRAASWCDCIGKREEWYYGRGREKKLVPCIDGTIPYHTISYHTAPAATILHFHWQSFIHIVCFLIPY